MRADVATALIAPGPPAVLPPTRPPCPILGRREVSATPIANRRHVVHLHAHASPHLFALRRCYEKVSPDVGARAGTSLLIPATGG